MSKQRNSIELKYFINDSYCIALTPYSYTNIVGLISKEKFINEYLKMEDLTPVEKIIYKEELEILHEMKQTIFN